MYYVARCYLCETRERMNGAVNAEFSMRKHVRENHPDEWAALLKTEKELQELKNAVYKLKHTLWTLEDDAQSRGVR